MYTFLIIDDEPAIREVLESVLSAAFPGATCSLCASSEQAFEKLEQFSPDLITTDLSRPGNSGLDFLQEFRRRNRNYPVPIIVISAMVGRDDALELELYKAGCNATIAKPFSTVRLLREIERVLPFTIPKEVVLINLGREGPDLDYKVNLDLSTKDGRAALAKDVIAMANIGGGTIIVGVNEVAPGKFSDDGIPEESAEKLEQTRLMNAIGNYLDPIVAVEAHRFEYRSKVFVAISVPAAPGMIVLARKSNEAASLYTGRIYSRSAGAESCEVTSSS